MIIADDTDWYHFETACFSPNSRIFSLISGMACFDSHVPPVIPAQFLFGLVFVVLGGWLGLMLRCRMA